MSKVKSYEGLSSRMLESDKAKFIDQFSGFGISDQKIIDQLLSLGKIESVSVFDDYLKVFYKTGKHKEVDVKKSEVKNIDPQTNKVIDTQIYFEVVLRPKSNRYKEMSPEDSKYYPHEKQKRKDLVELTEEIEKGRIIDD